MNGSQVVKRTLPLIIVLLIIIGLLFLYGIK